MAATYKDIQRLTGLSLSTISKYFNGKNITGPNRALIEQAVTQLDYKVNVFAQSLKSQRSKAVGILLPELTSIFTSRVMSEAGVFLRSKGYGSIVCDCHGKPEELEAESMSFLLSRQVDGIISSTAARKPESLELAANEGIPVVVLDRYIKEYPVDCVLLDNRQAGMLAVEKLVEKGHRKIGVITGGQWHYSMNERKWGVWRALQKHGITPDSRYFVYSGFTVEEGRQSAVKLLSMQDPPTALVATNDMLSLGMIVAAQELKLDVPGDISMIGFDCELFAGVLGKKLCMIIQPYAQLANTATEIILNRMDNIDYYDKRQCIMLPPIWSAGETIKQIMGQG